MCQLSTLQSMSLNDVAFMPNDRYAWIYSAIDIAEIFLGLLSAVIVGFSMYVFSCCPMFSRNTMLLAYTAGVDFYGMLLSRLIVIFLYMSKGKSSSSLIEFFSCTFDIQFFEYSRIGFITSYFAALSCLTIERFIATVQLANYEKQNNFYFVLFSNGSQIFAFFSGFFARLYDWVPFECAVLATAFLNWTIFASFMYVEQINYRRYKNAQNISVGLYTLNERFQLSENVRTSRVLKETMVLCCTLNTVCQVAVFVVYFSTNPLVRQVSVAVFNFTILFYAITFVANPMSTVPLYKRKINDLLHNFCCPNTVATIQQLKTPVLIDLTGNPMTFNVSDETNVYFEALKKQWE